VDTPVSIIEQIAERIRRTRRIRSTVCPFVLIRICTTMYMHCRTFLHVGASYLYCHSLFGWVHNGRNDKMSQCYLPVAVQFTILSWMFTFTFLIILTFHLIYAYHIPILSCYYLGSYLLLSYASIFHLIHTASYLFDYLCTFYIPSYCSIFRSLPIGRSTPLISWHCSSLSFLLNSKYFWHSYW